MSIIDDIVKSIKSVIGKEKEEKKQTTVHKTVVKKTFQKKHINRPQSGGSVSVRPQQRNSSSRNSSSPTASKTPGKRPMTRTVRTVRKGGQQVVTNRSANTTRPNQSNSGGSTNKPVMDRKPVVVGAQAQKTAKDVTTASNPKKKTYKRVVRTVRKAPEGGSGPQKRPQQRNNHSVRPVNKRRKPVRSISEALIGVVTHYLPQKDVAVIRITDQSIQIGDQLLVKGKITNFNQMAMNLQANNMNMTSAKKGEQIGLKIDKPVKVGDKVFRLG